MSNKNKAIQGAKWTTISTVINTILQFGQVAVIARILAPSAFGIVSISTLVISFLSIFAHFGFANSIIYKQESDRKSLSTIYYFNIIIGLLMFVVIYLSSPLLIAYYKEPRLAEVLKVSAFYFPIVFAGQIYSILLEKELKFKSLAFIDISSSLLSTTVTVSLAYKGFQEMALIYGLLAGQFVRMILQNYLGRKYFNPVLYFNLNEIKDHLKFGAFNIGDSIIGFANSNIDTILIGGLLGIKQLGYYTIASQIAIFPVQKICPIIIQICYPIMAKMKDNLEGLKNAYLKIVDFITYVNIPLLGGLFIMAVNVIPLIYGPLWGPTIPLIKIFVFMGIFSCLNYPLSPLAYSKGKPDRLFYLNLVSFIIKFPLIFIMAENYGITGVAVGFLVATIISTIMNFFVVQYLIGSFMKTFLNNIFKPVIFCLIMAVVILIYRHFAGEAGLVNVLIQIALGGLVYIGLTLKFKLSFNEIMALKKSV